jgi:hypothetical protein
MRALTVSNTAVDLGAQTHPFVPGNTVAVLNDTAGSLVLQSSDDNSTYATLATVPAHTAQNVTLDKQYIKVSTAANLMLLGN